MTCSSICFLINTSANIRNIINYIETRGCGMSATETSPNVMCEK